MTTQRLSQAARGEHRRHGAAPSHARRARRLGRANLSGADLSDADLRGANLGGANLSDTSLPGTDFRGASLRRADLSNSDLRDANLAGASLFGADLGRATCGITLLARADLRRALGLDTVVHTGPSSIGVDTLAQSKGQISPGFLRGCGLADCEVEAAKLHDPDLTPNEISELQYRINVLQFPEEGDEELFQRQLRRLLNGLHLHYAPADEVRRWQPRT